MTCQLIQCGDMGFLYLIESPTGKRYIGITSQDLKARWRAHRAHAKRCLEGHLQKAIRKYGSSNFTCKPLVRADDYEYLKELEKRAIVSFRTKHPNGYNHTDGGDGVLGVKITKAQREKRSLSQKKSFLNPQRKENHRLAQQDPELREKRKLTQQGKWRNPEFRKSLLLKMKNRWSDPDFRERMKLRRPKRKINDGLTNVQRHRLKDLEAYRKRKREWAKTPAQRVKRLAYMRLWCSRNRERYNEMCRLSRNRRKELCQRKLI